MSGKRDKQIRRKTNQLINQNMKQIAETLIKDFQTYSLKYRFRMAMKILLRK
jgi:hypothetical protein